MYTEKELEAIARQFLSRNFQIDLHIPIKRNNRLRSSLGRYVMDREGSPLRIELSGYLLTYGKKEVVIGVLKHECIHYAFHQKGKPMEDGTYEFEQALKRYGAPSTKTLKVGKFYTFLCKKCKKEGETRLKRIRTHHQQYRTKCCHAPVILTGEKIYDGSVEERT